MPAASSTSTRSAGGCAWASWSGGRNWRFAAPCRRDPGVAWAWGSTRPAWAKTGAAAAWRGAVTRIWTWPSAKSSPAASPRAVDLPRPRSEVRTSGRRPRPRAVLRMAATARRWSGVAGSRGRGVGAAWGLGSAGWQRPACTDQGRSQGPRSGLPPGAGSCGWAALAATGLGRKGVRELGPGVEVRGQQDQQATRRAGPPAQRQVRLGPGRSGHRRPGCRSRCRAGAPRRSPAGAARECRGWSARRSCTGPGGLPPERRGRRPGSRPRGRTGPGRGDDWRPVPLRVGPCAIAGSASSAKQGTSDLVLSGASAGLSGRR